jgi:3-dehydroquinate dehydratase, type I
MKPLNGPAVVGTLTKNIGETADLGRKLGADVLEIRFDLLLKNTPEFEKYSAGGSDEKLVAQLLLWAEEAKKTGLLTIGTLRTDREGGAYSGNEKERFALIEEIIKKVDFMDIERESDGHDILKCREAADQSNTKLILSSHFFNETPTAETMEKIISDSFEKGADIAKIAVMPKTADDVLNLYKAGLKSEKRNALCLIAMGEIGKQTRIAAPFYGSVLSYGYIDEVAAPGQLRVDEIKIGFKLLGLI